MNAEAENTADATESEQKKGGLSSILIWVVVAVVGVGAGFATPLLLLPKDSSAASEEQQEPELAIPIPDPNEEVAFIPFGKDVVANFNDPRFSRYLKLKFSLQIAKSQTTEITGLIEEKQDLLMNWLIGHIADLRAEDIKGMQGQNRLRREIYDQFNHLLFPDGIERIQDVLFQELNIQ